MGDTMTPEQRHRTMSRIRSADTQPEMTVRCYLHAHGFRYRLHVKELPGRPDIVMPKHRAVVNVNGCFWHAHEGCQYFRVPTSNRSYWERKIERNVARDQVALTALRAAGWKVFTVWECELKRDADYRCRQLAAEITAN